MSPWSHCYNRNCAHCPVCTPYMCPFFQEWAWITEIWWLFFVLPGAESDVWGNGPPWWQTGPDGCLNKLTRLLIFYLFFHRVCFISRTLTWGGVLLIPRSADEWRQGQTHMHVRIASIHSLSSGRGGSTPNQRGGNLTPSQTATCTAFQLIQPQNFTLVL